MHKPTSVVFNLRCTIEWHQSRYAVIYPNRQFTSWM